MIQQMTIDDAGKIKEAAQAELDALWKAHGWDEGDKPKITEGIVHTIVNKYHDRMMEKSVLPR